MANNGGKAFAPSACSWGAKEAAPQSEDQTVRTSFVIFADRKLSLASL